jgi:hypothetical protein
MKTNYASRVESYLCEHHRDLGEQLTTCMRRTLEDERPLTKEDVERWIYSINIHIPS